MKIQDCLVNNWLPGFEFFWFLTRKSGVHFHHRSLFHRHNPFFCNLSSRYRYNWNNGQFQLKIEPQQKINLLLEWSFALVDVKPSARSSHFVRNVDFRAVFGNSRVALSFAINMRSRYSRLERAKKKQPSQNICSFVINVKYHQYLLPLVVLVYFYGTVG